MYASQTVSRLHAVLTGFVPAATLTLFTAGFVGRGADVGGATVGFMGLVLGCALGVPLGLWIDRRGMQPADYRLPLLIGLLCLPLALLPLQPELFGTPRFGHRGLTAVLGGVAAAVPLGGCMGASWAIWSGSADLDRRGRFFWGGMGMVLGCLLSFGAVLVLSVFKGAALINLFAAPLVWPTLPRSGDRSLLARMLLTLVVVVSTMFLLFL